MIYVTGDTHGDFSRFSSNKFPEGRDLTKDDVIIIAGDFGLWHPTDEEKYWMGWLGKKSWTTVFVDGNHENFDRLDALPEVDKWDGKVGVLNDWHSIYHLKRGYIYTINDKKIFTFGGGYSIDIMNRIPYRSWWPQELPNYQEYKRGLDNLESIGYYVDYIISHSCSNKDFNLMSQKHEMSYKNVDDENQLRNYFDLIHESVSFDKWFCGHFHVNNEVHGRTHFLYRDIVRVV